MANVGINGLGRIGKCVLLQLLEEKCSIKAINIPGFNVNNLQTYLEHDTVHTCKPVVCTVVSESKVILNGREIVILNDRDASKLNWRSHGVEYVIDTTGVYLTSDACEKHDVDYVIMCAPPKDNSDQFVFNVNHHEYKGERFVSNASCTTNCLTPVLKVLEDNWGIESASFTTIHSCTASQSTTDTNNFKNRTSRSVFNNIIPHSTGANKSVTRLIPSLAGKVAGTSLRVPTSNVSIVDLVVTLTDKGKGLTKDDIVAKMEKTNFVQVNRKSLVSSDFMSTTYPSIIDYHASMKLPGERDFKLMIWYDNEWSYVAQVIRLLNHMYKYNEEHNNNKSKYFIENHNFSGRRVIIRVDWNVPINEDGIIQDPYRIVSSLRTIEYVLKDNPEKVILVSHFGRPDSSIPQIEWENSIYSWTKYMNQLKVFFPGDDLQILRKGLHKDSLEEINNSKSRLFLLENIRFHKEETKFEKISSEDRASNPIINLFNELGDFYVNDAFGCCHREHMSIVGFQTTPDRPKAFGFLIDKEISCLEIINKNKNNDKILSIVGGGKMKDKLELMKKMSKKVDGIFIAGGNVNSIYYDSAYDSYLEELQQNKAKITLMKDGLCAKDLSTTPVYRSHHPEKDDININRSMDYNDDEKKLFFDIGMESIIELNSMIQDYDTIFWNGTLGVVENKLYSYGSTTLVHLLMKSGKKVIIGGGDTACFVQNNFKHNFHFVSTGGGASLDYIARGTLAGVEFFDK